MKTYNITLKLLTPCITAGADQKQAEFRAPSIRGMLRHWFRLTGGTKDEEMKIFGSVHDEIQKSKVVVRVLKTPDEPDSKTPREINGNKDGYFLGSWLGKDIKRGYFKKGGEAVVQIISKLDSADLEKKFENALNAWLILGSLGYRSRRTYGSIWPKEVKCNDFDVTESFVPKTWEELKKKDFASVVEIEKCPDPEKFLKDKRGEFGEDLGYAKGKNRLASPLYFKKIGIGETIIVFSKDRKFFN